VQTFPFCLVIAVVDGMGVSIGAQIVTQLRRGLSLEVESIAPGTNIGVERPGQLAVQSALLEGLTNRAMKTFSRLEAGGLRGAFQFTLSSQGGHDHLAPGLHRRAGGQRTASFRTIGGLLIFSPIVNPAAAAYQLTYSMNLRLVGAAGLVPFQRPWRCGEHRRLNLYFCRTGLSIG